MLSKKLYLLIALGIILLAVAAGTAAYYINRYQDSKLKIQELNKKLSNPSEVAKQEQQNLIAKVGALTALPSGETPTIATVTDVNKLKDQSFFASAENGDKVLIYTKAKKAYLYRPSTNKIINIAPVNLGKSQNSGTSSDTQNQTTTP